MPPPTAASVALEMFAEARHKRLHALHVFIIPRLATSLWRKQLGKDADLIFEIPVGSDIWPLTQHEPLVVAFVLPLEHKTKYRGPWVVKETKMPAETCDRIKAEFARGVEERPCRHYDLEGSVRGMRGVPCQSERDILREFLCRSGKFPSMPESVVRGMLQRGSGIQVPNQRVGGGGKRRRSNRGQRRRHAVQGGAKRGSPDGDSLLLRSVPVQESARKKFKRA